MASDQALLARYADSRSAEAFAELVRRYAGMVYGTGLRITRNAADAEDVAQQCFLQLARNAGAVRASFAGWLHRAAVTRAVNAIRDAATRRRHEEQAMARHSDEPETAWSDIAPHVDAALDDLPDRLCAPVMLHYLQGRSQAETAEALGVNQSTVSRRIEKGVDALRARLRKAGVVVSVAALVALLGDHAAVAAPPALTAALGKMALAGVGTSAAAAAAGVGSAALAGKVAAVLIAVTLVTGGIVFSLRKPSPPAGPMAPITQPDEVPSSVTSQPDKEPTMTVDQKPKAAPQLASTDLFAEGELARWRLTPGYEGQKPWRFADGAYEGFQSWVAHPGVFDDFVLDVEINFSGKAEGGIVIRGDHTSRKPWESGYETDIDWHAGREHGHIHYPVKPKPYPGFALIEPNRWHAVRIRAVGETVTTFLDGEQVIQFADAERPRGNICLEGHTDGVRYRNLRITPLAKGAPATLTDEKKQRLKQWANLFGSLEKCVAAAGRDPVFYELLRLELALEPMSAEARKMRSVMGYLEPAELTYPHLIDALFAGLAACDARGGSTRDWPAQWKARKEHVAELAKQLRAWSGNGSGRLAPALGKPDDVKRRLVTLAIQRLEEDKVDPARMKELGRDEPLGQIAYRIEHLDWQLWSHERNFDLLARSIGRLRPVGEWHTLNGPLCWGDGHPVGKPKAETMRARLDAWLAGGADAALGAPDAYPEKVWLVRCLTTYLRYHLREYWDWMEKGAEVKRDGNKALIDGVPPARGDGNGYVRGLETVLACIGSPVGYDRLMGLSGMAFIVQADTQHRWEGKVGVGWWPLDPWGLQLRRAFLSRAVGRELAEVGWITCTPEQFVAMRDRLPEVYREHIEPHVKRSINAGRPVLATCDFGFVIAGYDDETRKPPVLGRCGCDTKPKQYYRPDNWPIGLFVSGDRTKPMDRDAADVAALRHAVALAHDRGGPRDAAWRDRRFTGQKAFAAWAALLRNIKEPVEDRHHANMKLNLRWNRTAAVGYLKDVAARHKGKAGDALLQGAATYEQVLELLKQMAPKGLARDAEKRRGLAALVDRIAALELLAAQHMERAIMHMTVKRDGDKVWIDGVKGFSPAEYADSVHGSQARILQAVGEEITYDDLICYGGFAFRIGWHKAGCPSAGHPCCGYMCLKNAFRALPWQTKIYELFPGDKKPQEEVARFKAEVCAAIKRSIDRGIPVHYGGEEDGLIIGYADEGRRWWCVHPYHKQGREAFWYDEVRGFAGGQGNWPWGIVIFLKPKLADKRADERELTVAALKQAVEMWKTEKREDYFCGDAAYALWIDWLRGVDAGTVEKPKEGMQGNGWCFDVLVHSRNIAGRWLKQKAEGSDGPARKSLLAAADHYARIGPICMEGLGCSWELAPEPKKFDTWTAEMRRDQIARLEAAREHDRTAIAAIDKALAALD